MMIRILLAAGSILTIASIAAGTPYWVAYEGDDFPENVGWSRGVGSSGGKPPGAYREILDGEYLLLDSRIEAWEGGADDYSFARPDSFDPGAGEYFLAEWRVWSDATVTQFNGTDSAVFIFSDRSYTAAIGLACDRVINSNPFDDAEQVNYISPGVMHDYVFISYDMLAYELYVDDQPAFSGSFTSDGPWEAEVGFGDVAAGLSSRSEWDYVRFGVVPEPTSVLLIIVLAGCHMFMPAKYGTPSGQPADLYR